MARRKYSVDEALIARYLKEGRGTGLGADYKPWLRISDVPSLGRSHRLRGIKTGRVHHFLSDIEVNLFYLLCRAMGRHAICPWTKWRPGCLN